MTDSYIGVPPQSGFISQEANQYFTGLTQNFIDLNQSISSLSSVIVLVNGVVQENSTMSLTSSTRITLGATLVSGDKVTCIYVAKISSTQAPATGSVTSDMLSGSIANSKLANSSITLNGSAVSLGGSASVGGDNTPMFAVSKSSSQNIGQNTTTKITFDNEYIDTDNAFASNKFTCPSGGAGNYSMTMSILFHKLNTTYLKGIEIAAYKNGAPINYGNDLGEANFGFIADTSYFTQVQGITTFIVTLAENDYVECYGKAIPSNGNDTQVYNYYTHWTGHKLIT